MHRSDFILDSHFKLTLMSANVDTSHPFNHTVSLSVYVLCIYLYTHIYVCVCMYVYLYFGGASWKPTECLDSSLFKLSTLVFCMVSLASHIPSLR